MSEDYDDDSDYYYEEQIREEERRRQEAERVRREQQERERLAETNKNEIEKLLRFTENIATGDLAHFVDQTEIRRIEAQAAECARENRPDKITQPSLQALHKKIASLATNLDRLEYEAQKRLSEHLVRLEQEKKKQLALARLNFVSKIASKFAGSEYLRLVSQDVNEIQNSIGKISGQIEARNFEHALSLLDGVESLCSLTSENLEIKKNFLSSLQRLSDKLTDLENDPVYRIWTGAEIGTIQKRLFKLQSDLERERRPQVGPFQSTLESINAQITQIQETADKKQSDEVVRRKVVETIMETLRDEGFTVTDPKLESDQSSNVVLIGTKPGRARKQSILARVGLDGRIFFDSDSGDPGDLAKIREAQVDRDKESNVACHQTMVHLREVLGRKGLRLRDAKRSWHNPDRIAKGAKEAPTGAGQQRRN